MASGCRAIAMSVGIALVASLACPRPAHATINLTGHWNLRGKFPGALGPFFFESWTVTQAGTALTQSPPSGGQLSPRTGTIDSTTGAFTLADAEGCFHTIGPDYCQFSGTAAPDGLSFTGTLDCLTPTPSSCGFPFGPANVIAVRAPDTCGNGVVDAGEQCDDGTSSGLPGSCCSLACQFVQQGTSCDTQASVCVTHDVCDGAGQCGPGGLPLECDGCSSCDPMTGACVVTPATNCRKTTAARAASLTLKTSGPRLVWTWRKGEATSLGDFGDPVGTDAYSLCVYDATPSPLRFDLAIPPGSAWRTKPIGFVYTDKLGAGDGVTKVVLHSGGNGKAMVGVKAKGPHLSLPSLQFHLPVTVQLRSHGECWGAVYASSGVKKASSSEFVAKSSPSGAFVDDSPPRL